MVGSRVRESGHHKSCLLLVRYFTTPLSCVCGQQQLRHPHPPESPETRSAWLGFLVRWPFEPFSGTSGGLLDLPASPNERMAQVCPTQTNAKGCLYTHDEGLNCEVIENYPRREYEDDVYVVAEQQ